MTSLRFAVLAAGLALASAECDVCHLHYYHKVSEPPTLYLFPGKKDKQKKKKNTPPLRCNNSGAALLHVPSNKCLSSATRIPLKPPTFPPSFPPTGSLHQGGLRCRCQALPRVPVRVLLHGQDRLEVRPLTLRLSKNPPQQHEPRRDARFFFFFWGS